MKIISISKLTILLLTIFYYHISFADYVIRKITIEGNHRVERSTIESYLKLNVGETYNNSKEDEAIKRLYATSLFRNINMYITNDGNLIVNVTETPFISSVVFSGNSKIKTNILAKEIYTMSGESLSQAKIELDVKKILEIYKRSGRFSTKVTPKIKSLENNRVKVIFDIAEGPKTVIKSIYFSGNEHYSDSELKSIVLTKESRWFRFLESNDTYDPDRVEYDKELLREFYQSVGFADFRVISASVALNDTKEYFTITYSIEEGEKYRFGNVTIDNKLTNINIKQLNKIVNIKQGKIFNMKTVDDIAEKIGEYFTANGYPAVNVYPDIKKNDNHTADIKFIIEKADKVYINKINIINNLKTEDHVIRRAFKIEEGDVMNRSYIEKGERNLRNLDYFEKVSISLAQTKAKDKYDVNVEVDEKSTSSIGFDLGYNTAGGLFGRFSFLERNLVGTGKLLNAGVQVSKNSTSYYGCITDPHFLDRDLSLSVNAFRNYTGRGASVLNTTDQSYKLHSIGVKISLGYDMKEDLSHEIDYLIKRDILSAPSPSNSIFLNEQMGKLITSAIGHTITYDQTDNKIVPKNGYLVSGTQEFAGVGGDNKYIKHEIECKFYKSFINNKVTLKLSAAGGDMAGLGGKMVRISDRFNLGDYSLRGFASGGVGPREKNTNEGLGGERYYTFSTELNFPTPVPEEFNFTGAVFIDLGSVWGVGLNKKQYKTPNGFYNDQSLRASVGFGFIWVTRFAPIRMDWGFPIKKKQYDDTQNFHLRFSTHL
ncbi:outer membrane protein assembly factor BamA [Rickettsia prowazekii]|uniref:Outer membrane protein assembly factor BamA n=2 Tax=Rickettsia prowazekii TaxID=782 RepID=Q9ZE03_RICPR|nr:outer membrane protein assembly factor BamA [Rickettsia prowazekii]ADE29669.1 Outer membrane protein omp1 [Rickettsia prowazekii str. Rp22]AFE48981.1 outer membrane protein omp1 [Rickettsia prowazekii str. Chernikova]AFE49826.1 outer membrane protein omp1 [Rickettsia prowazekii str. Katsinyian]AFE50670.1 outer membrane protein omp1 [Rickettsia prowazekii str. BuV67-CWPP]AFE51511.1 outer membrane protein omp1 [Rickettsia prowazekii str. Dachau]